MPNEPPALALLGCGYWGKNLARVFHQLGALTLVCDPIPEGRAQAKVMAPGVVVAEDCQHALASGIEAVVIATPAVTHYDLARQALEAGKDVFVEKPLTLTLEDGHRLVQLAQVKKRVLMVGHVLEYHPAIRVLHDLVLAGKLGEIHYLHSHRLSLGKVRREENVLWSFAPHDIALFLRLVGRMPTQVACCGGNYLQPQVADAAAIQLGFGPQVRGYAFVSWLHPFKEHRLVVVGSRQMACLDDVAKKLYLYDTRVEIHESAFHPVKGEGREVAFSSVEPLQVECEAFLVSVKSRQPALTDGISALRVLQVLRAAQQSLENQGMPVSL